MEIKDRLNKIEDLNIKKNNLQDKWFESCNDLFSDLIITTNRMRAYNMLNSNYDILFNINNDNQIVSMFSSKLLNDNNLFLNEFNLNNVFDTIVFRSKDDYYFLTKDLKSNEISLQCTNCKNIDFEKRVFKNDDCLSHTINLPNNINLPNELNSFVNKFDSFVDKRLYELENSLNNNVKSIDSIKNQVKTENQILAKTKQVSNKEYNR